MKCDFCGKTTEKIHTLGDEGACAVCYFKTMRGDRRECVCDWSPTPGEIIVVDDPAQGYYNCPICGGERLLAGPGVPTLLENNDPISSPAHYKLGKFGEVIDIIGAWIAVNDVSGLEVFLWANVIKYLFRYKQKNGPQDLKKAEWYLQRLINEVGKESDE